MPEEAIIKVEHSIDETTFEEAIAEAPEKGAIGAPAAPVVGAEEEKGLLGGLLDLALGVLKVIGIFKILKFVGVNFSGIMKLGNLASLGLFKKFLLLGIGITTIIISIALLTVGIMLAVQFAQKLAEFSAPIAVALGQLEFAITQVMLLFSEALAPILVPFIDIFVVIIQILGPFVKLIGLLLKPLGIVLKIFSKFFEFGAKFNIMLLVVDGLVFLLQIWADAIDFILGIPPFSWFFGGSPAVTDVFTPGAGKAVTGVFTPPAAETPFIFESPAVTETAAGITVLTNIGEENQRTNREQLREQRQSGEEAVLLVSALTNIKDIVSDLATKSPTEGILRTLVSGLGSKLIEDNEKRDKKKAEKEENKFQQRKNEAQLVKQQDPGVQNILDETMKRLQNEEALDNMEDEPDFNVFAIGAR